MSNKFPKMPRDQAAFARRTVARKARGYVRYGDSVDGASARCNISRISYYRWVKELEDYEEAHPEAAMNEHMAEVNGRYDQARALHNEGSSIKEIEKLTELHPGDIQDAIDGKDGDGNIIKFNTDPLMM